MTDSYEDIIALPHHVSAFRPHMSIADRAAQFSPFAALTGHDAAIQETARFTDLRKERDQDLEEALRRKLNLLADRCREHPEIVVVYFMPDDQKDGGRYVAAMGKLKKIEDYEGILIMMDGTRIPLEDILQLESGLLTDQA